MNLSIEQRVANGAAQLDKMIPGWENRIDLDELDIRVGCRCIIGQLYLGYSRGKRFFPNNLRGDQAQHNLGLYSHSATEEDQDHDYELLTGAWKAAIEVRLEANDDASQVAIERELETA